MLERKVAPPFVPDIKSDQDISHIDGVFTKEKPSETPEESSLLKKKQFENFTYVEQSSLN